MGTWGSGNFDNDAAPPKPEAVAGRTERCLRIFDEEIDGLEPASGVSTAVLFPF